MLGVIELVRAAGLGFGLGVIELVRAAGLSFGVGVVTGMPLEVIELVPAQGFGLGVTGIPLEVIELVRAAGLGFGLGVVTGIPLGVINVAIADAATAGRRRFALGLGLGGGIADAVHAVLAFAGVGQLVTAKPALVRGLTAAAVLAVIGYAIAAWRRRASAPVAATTKAAAASDSASGRPCPAAAASDGDSGRPCLAATASDSASGRPCPAAAASDGEAVKACDSERRDGGRLIRGAVTGVMLTLPNPGALAAWLTVAASVWPNATLPEAGACATGVGAGSALWFGLLARGFGRVRPGHPAARWIPRVALILLIAIAAAGAVRVMTAVPA